MRIDSKAVSRLVKELRLISDETLSRVESSIESGKRDLLSALVEGGYVGEREAAEIASDILGVSVARVSDMDIPDHVLRVIPFSVARAERIIAIRFDDRGLAVAMQDPTNVRIPDFLVKKTGMPVRVFLAAPSDIDFGLGLYTRDLGKTFDDMMSERIAKAENEFNQNENTSQAPIIRIVDTLFLHAYQNKSSDIHIEPREKNSVVRFRVDGILYDVLTFSEAVHEQVVARLKVLARLRTDEHFVPQDGKLRVEIEGSQSPVDIRISVVPTTNGEKVVLRLLAEYVRRLSLPTLGLSSASLERVSEAYRKSHGMILSTGPTGSGKTTTLYALLKILNKPNVNIMTIEDPVEYDIEGVNQMQVNHRAGFSFASGLKSILRQDPNVILVGEIRDSETAGIAVNLAMTGHLVLSTLHSNDAATAVPRLLDLGVEPFLVSSTISVIISQRLVRRIHEPCRVSREISLADLRAQLGDDAVRRAFPAAISSKKSSARVYQGKGCAVCHGSGYSGRIGIFEVLSMSDLVRQSVAERATAAEIQAIARRQGMVTLLEDGLEKVRQGITSVEEIVRVAQE